MNTETKRFVRHYVEMVVVMFAGMGVLYLPAEWALNAFGSGWSELADDGMLLVMAATMVIPMVAWMAWRGHSRRANAEMAGAMLAAMLVAMLLRADEYRHHRHHGAVAA